MTGIRRGEGRWTTRFVVRLVGLALLAVVVIMALLGAYVLDFSASARSFFIYWSVFFVLLMSVIAVALFDTVATIVRFRKEHAKLRSAFRRELRGENNAEP
jgi:hypothetical protein